MRKRQQRLDRLFVAGHIIFLLLFGLATTIAMQQAIEDNDPTVHTQQVRPWQ